MSDIVTKLDNTEEPLLRLEDLSIDYRIRNGYLSAVSDVNFTMNPGEIVALVGESGCGKSTIAFTIMRLLMDGNEKIGGKILFKGEDLNKIPVRDMEKMRGKHIGMIFQNPLDSLNPVYRTGSQVEEAILLDGLSHKEACYKPLQGRAHSGCGKARKQLPARAFRRHAPARYDSHDAFPHAGAAYSGRAHHRA